MKGGWLLAVLTVALLIAVFALKGLLILPPEPPQRAGPGEFETARALARLQRTLGDEQPHPVDTAANDAVRQRLLRELRAIGLQPQVRQSTRCNAMPGSRAVSCARIHNIVATVPARSDGPHLLLNAHYDSTPAGPGAADDGLGVATMLEVGAILRASPPQRPVTLLFNEGEEFGLNGAAAFIRDDPLAPRVNSLINIEARGVSGPALMFETSEPNAAAIAIYDHATRRPYANSLSADFAKLIPNSTDVVEFKPAGWTLLNYSIIGNETRYHTPGDTIAALSRASLYHMGSEVLAATRAFASTAAPASVSSGRSVFTDIAGRLFIRLPLTVALIGVGLLLAAALFLGWRRKALGKPLLVTLAVALAGIIDSAIAAYLAGWLRAGDFYRAYPLVTYLAVYAVMLATMTGVWLLLGRRIERERARAAAWLVVLLSGAALSFAVPGASIFFLVPPAIALTAVAVSRRSSTGATALAWAAILLQLLMFAELLALIEMLLVDGPLWAVAPLAALAALPPVVEVEAKRYKPALALISVAAVGLWLAALTLPRASEERPLAFSIEYLRDAAAGEANWAIANKQAPLPNGFPGGWEKKVLPHNGRTRWVAEAPLLDTPEPKARLLSIEPAAKGRRVRLALSPGGGDAVSIRFAEEAKLVSVGLPGSPIKIPQDADPEKALLRCSGRACDGLVIEAVLADREPVTAELFSTRFTLPPEARALRLARPRNAQPQYSPDQSVTRTVVRF